MKDIGFSFCANQRSTDGFIQKKNPALFIWMITKTLWREKKTNRQEK